VVQTLTANRTFPFIPNGTTLAARTATTTGGVAPIQYQFWRYSYEPIRATACLQTQGNLSR
jgi:hypothetical protein